MQYILSIFLILLSFMSWLPSVAEAQRSTPTLVSRGVQTSDPSSWKRYTVKGVTYMRAEDLMAFYKFRLLKNVGRVGYTSYGAANRYVSFRPGRLDFYVNNYRYILSHPILAQDGHNLISTIDVSKLVDPVLRPQFSTQAGRVTTVVLDAGHGGHDSGAVSSYAIEKECNLELARKVRDILIKKGFKVVMTRDSDFFLTLQQRVNIANKVPNSIFVSIHHNSGRSAAEGIETFTLAPQGTTSPFARKRLNHQLQGNHQDSENIALATAVHSRTIKASGAVDRGIQRARFSVLCTIRRPAILFEGGFVSNAKEGRRIASSIYQNTLAAAIAEGIIAYSVNVGGAKSRLRSNDRARVNR